MVEGQVCQCAAVSVAAHACSNVQRCGVRVAVSHLKETSTPGPICLIWTFLLEELKNFFDVILQYTIIMSHNTSSPSWESDFWSRSRVKLFSAGVGVRVWSPKFSNPGVRVRVPKNKDSTSLVMWITNKLNCHSQSLSVAVKDKQGQ